MPQFMLPLKDSLKIADRRVDASSGALTPIAQNNVLGVHAFSLAMHPSGKFLYAADWNSSIAGFTICAAVHLEGDDSSVCAAGVESPKV